MEEEKERVAEKEAGGEARKGEEEVTRQNGRKSLCDGKRGRGRDEKEEEEDEENKKTEA